jgi:hypothetical protein
MKAIVINPFDETIEEAIYLGHYKEIYSFLECRTFDCVYLDNREVLYIDDEGLLIEETKYFSLNNRIFAGKGLILGSDKDGETSDVGLTLQMVKDMVEWLPEGHKEEPFIEVTSWK